MRNPLPTSRNPARTRPQLFVMSQLLSAFVAFMSLFVLSVDLSVYHYLLGFRGFPHLGSGFGITAWCLPVVMSCMTRWRSKTVAWWYTWSDSRFKNFACPATKLISFAFLLVVTFSTTKLQQMETEQSNRRRLQNAVNACFGRLLANVNSLLCCQCFYAVRYLGHPWHPRKILRRSSKGNPSVGGAWGLNARRVAKYSDFGPIEGYLGNGAR